MQKYLLRFLLVVLLLPWIIAIVEPVSLWIQYALGGLAIIIGYLLKARQDVIYRATLCLLSLTISLRYFYWRITETVHSFSFWDLFFMWLLLLSELYAFVLTILGYFQTVNPLPRESVPLPSDTSRWPSVDVFIPTYNEPLDVVRPTVLAAISLDYPRDKFSVYVLDDGRRDEFKRMVEEINQEFDSDQDRVDPNNCLSRNSVIYLTRPDNLHAKAGNLNHALMKSHGDLILVFDCDHIPKRNFLKKTVGAFIKEPDLAILQTPHHFYLKDSFARNLNDNEEIPSESELFYYVIQPGNDLWNAAYFCGASGVLRRSALERIGGFATDTVTEDAHTSLKLHRLGYSSAYLKEPLAAGLSPEFFSAMVSQRMRWGRGMIQIFRIENPLFCKGLTFAQRLCYSNSIFYWFFGIPRIVFLTSPLMSLFFGVDIIKAPLLGVIAYVLPHLWVANLANASLHQKFRHSLWSEIYEASLSFYLVMPTIVTLYNPKLGKFNVTPKGGINQREFFDMHMALPHVALLILSIAGLFTGVAKFFYFYLSHDPMRIFLLNKTVVNLIWETYNTMIVTAGIGVAFESRQIRKTHRVTIGENACILLPMGETTEIIEGRLVDLSLGGYSFKPSIEIAHSLGKKGILRVEDNGVQIELPIVVSCHQGILRGPFPILSLEEERNLVFLIFGRDKTWTKIHDNLVPDSFSYSVRELLKALRSRIRKTLFSSSFHSIFLLFFLVIVGLINPLITRADEGLKEKTVQIPLNHPVVMRKDQPYGQFSFGLIKENVIVEAKLFLKINLKPPVESSALRIFVNEIPVGQIQHLSGKVFSIPLDPRNFMDYNTISFEWISSEKKHPLSCTTQLTIDKRSSLILSVASLPFADDLSILPEPFFDKNEVGPLDTSFVFLHSPSKGTEKAAGIVASWLGTIADWRGTHFSAMSTVPSKNAILFLTSKDASSSVGILGNDIRSSPSVLMRTNPMDPTKKILVLSASNGQELVRLARILVNGIKPNKKDPSVYHPSLPLRATYVKNDFFSRELPYDKITRFDHLYIPPRLSSSGMIPSPLSLEFRLPPALFLWRNRGIPLTFTYHYEALPGFHPILWIRINGKYLDRINLTAPHDKIKKVSFSIRKKLMIPSRLLGKQNKVQFFYDPNQKKAKKGCLSFHHALLHTWIDPDGSIDLRKIPLFTTMPDLSLFLHYGYPFTRFPNLDHTAFFFGSDKMNALSSYLNLLGFWGGVTGIPGDRFKIVNNLTVNKGYKRDILILGTSHVMAQLFKNKPGLPRVEGNLLYPEKISLIRSIQDFFIYNRVPFLTRESLIKDLRKNPEALILAFESPYSRNHALVAMITSRNGSINPAFTLDHQRKDSQDHANWLLVKRDGSIVSYPLGPTYFVGTMPTFSMIRWFLSDKLFLFIGMIGFPLFIWGLFSGAYLTNLSRKRLDSSETNKENFGL